MLQLTPGVHMAEASDKGDQRYTSPHQAVKEKGADLVIVGRGICSDNSPGLKVSGTSFCCLVLSCCVSLG